MKTAESLVPRDARYQPGVAGPMATSMLGGAGLGALLGGVASMYGVPHDRRLQVLAGAASGLTYGAAHGLRRAAAYTKKYEDVIAKLQAEDAAKMGSVESADPDEGVIDVSGQHTTRRRAVGAAIGAGTLGGLGAWKAKAIGDTAWPRLNTLRNALTSNEADVVNQLADTVASISGPGLMRDAAGGVGPLRQQLIEALPTTRVTPKKYIAAAALAAAAVGAGAGGVLGNDYDRKQNARGWSDQQKEVYGRLAKRVAIGALAGTAAAAAARYHYKSKGVTPIEILHKYAPDVHKEVMDAGTLAAAVPGMAVGAIYDNAVRGGYEAEDMHAEQGSEASPLHVIQPAMLAAGIAPKQVAGLAGRMVPIPMLGNALGALGGMARTVTAPIGASAALLDMVGRNRGIKLFRKEKEQDAEGRKKIADALLSTAQPFGYSYENYERRQSPTEDPRESATRRLAEFLRKRENSHITTGSVSPAPARG